ncbi:MAG TPA: metallopeptidase family protein [Candidatus Limnocylindrales bacterium]
MSSPTRPEPGMGAALDPEAELERRQDEFDQMVADAVEAIPSPYREQLDSVAIITDDEPAPGQQAPGTLLFGLYQGVPRTRWGATNTAIPSKITIFRRAHEIAFPDPVARALRVRSTVLHEVAHHLGIDDATLRRIEGGRDRGG